MSIEAKIKEELLKEVNGDIDALYDLLVQRFVLSPEDEEAAIRELNTLKNRLFEIVKASRLA